MFLTVTLVQNSCLINLLVSPIAILLIICNNIRTQQEELYWRILYQDYYFREREKKQIRLSFINKDSILVSVTKHIRMSAIILELQVSLLELTDEGLFQPYLRRRAGY